MKGRLPAAGLRPAVRRSAAARYAVLGALLGIGLGAAALPCQASVNSYRFLHVTIDTPWHIFLFLLMGIFAPFVLMVVLMWRNATRKRELAARAREAAARDGGPTGGHAPPPA
jgi:hypothetical protein